MRQVLDGACMVQVCASVCVGGMCCLSEICTRSRLQPLDDCGYSSHCTHGIGMHSVLGPPSDKA